MEFQSFILPVGWDANLIDGEGAGETWPVFEWIGEENGETEEQALAALEAINGKHKMEVGVY